MHPARTPKRVAVHYFGGGGGEGAGMDRGQDDRHNHLEH